MDSPPGCLVLPGAPIPWSWVIAQDFLCLRECLVRTISRPGPATSLCQVACPPKKAAGLIGSQAGPRNLSFFKASQDSDTGSSLELEQWKSTNSSCLEEVTSEVGLQDQERAGDQGGSQMAGSAVKEVDSVPREL